MRTIPSKGDRVFVAGQVPVTILPGVTSMGLKGGPGTVTEVRAVGSQVFVDVELDSGTFRGGVRPHFMDPLEDGAA